MKNYILFDSKTRHQLLPLTFIRPVSQIRVGVLTIQEKWERALNARVSQYIVHTADYLAARYPEKRGDMNVLINSSVLPNAALVKEINALLPGEKLVHKNKIIAAFEDTDRMMVEPTTHESKADALMLDYPKDIFLLNAKAMEADIREITKGRTSVPTTSFPESRFIGKDIFIEEGARITCAIINSSTGPVYIGKDVEIMEGAMIRGPFAACGASAVKMGAMIYGATTLGPKTVVGGELKNCVFFGNSNKGHEGYLGDSVIGEWCNLGANTTNSNLKNNMSSVKSWSYPDEDFVDSGQMKFGLIMGDYSRTAIGTKLNTGTVIGVGCSIASDGFPPKYVPNFSWLQGEEQSEYRFMECIEAIERMENTKGSGLTESDIELIHHIYNLKPQPTV